MTKINEKNSIKKGKLVKGIIIGGAIGSILGMTIAPKTGKETRAIIKNKSSGVLGSFARGMRALIQGKKGKK
jgi:gas vesicle protein